MCCLVEFPSWELEIRILQLPTSTLVSHGRKAFLTHNNSTEMSVLSVITEVLQFSDAVFKLIIVRISLYSPPET